jgi:hypothetical protein
MSQKKLIGYAGTATVVALGVMLAGYAMYKFSDNEIVAQARNGFQGVV